MFDKAVQPAHVDALKGKVITGRDRDSAKYLPASKTFPPPAAIIEVQLFSRIIFFILEISS